MNEIKIIFKLPTKNSKSAKRKNDTKKPGNWIFLVGYWTLKKFHTHKSVMTSKRIFRLSAYIVLACLLASCQADDILVQSPFGLSGAPLRYNDSEASKFLEVAAEFYGGISIIN